MISVLLPRCCGSEPPCVSVLSNSVKPTTRPLPISAHSPWNPSLTDYGVCLRRRPVLHSATRLVVVSCQERGASCTRFAPDFLARLSLKLTRVAYYRILRRVASYSHILLVLLTVAWYEDILFVKSSLTTCWDLSYLLAVPRVGRLSQHLFRPLKCNKSVTADNTRTS